MNQSNMMMNMLMGNLQRQNPTAYNQIQQWMNSGQNPQQILNELLQSGRISQSDINNAINLSKQYTGSNGQIKRF